MSGFRSKESGRFFDFFSSILFLVFFLILFIIVLVENLVMWELTSLNDEIFSHLNLVFFSILMQLFLVFVTQF